MIFLKSQHIAKVLQTGRKLFKLSFFLLLNGKILLPSSGGRQYGALTPSFISGSGTGQKYVQINKLTYKSIIT